MRNPGHISSSLLLALAGMVVLTSTAYAQQPDQDLSAGTAEAPRQRSPTDAAASQSGASQRGASQRGGIALKLMNVLITAYPSVRVDMQHSDNIYSAPNDKTADQILVLTPALRLEARQAGNTYSLRLGSTIGQYQNHTAENYTNYNLNGLADVDLGTRLRASLRADYIDAQDPRGSTNDPVSATPNRYRQTYGQSIFSYGAQGAQGRIDFELGRTQREYYNNRATTAANDRTVDNIGATFYWRAGPKTSLLFQGKHNKVDYALPTSTLGSIENMFLAGAQWEASAKTSGTFKLGVAQKVFNDPARASSTQPSWDGTIRWSPRSYSHVDLALSRIPAETTGGVGNSIDNTTTSALWTHDWSSRLATAASAGYSTAAYKGFARTDITQNYGLKATYKMRRWLSFGGDYTYSVRASDDPNFDYKRNVFMLFVDAAL